MWKGGPAGAARHAFCLHFFLTLAKEMQFVVQNRFDRLSPNRISCVTNMSSMFEKCKRHFTNILTFWDVFPSVKIMLEMLFCGASAFYQDMGAWKILIVGDMEHMVFWGKSVVHRSMLHREFLRRPTSKLRKGLFETKLEDPRFKKIFVS
jgi:hypothetical protein